jgi:integrase
MDAAQEEAPTQYPLLLCLFHTGMRIGEAMGLKWNDVDLDARRRSIFIQRSIDDKTGEEGTPKSGASRSVDVSLELLDALKKWKAKQAEQGLKDGSGELLEWVFRDVGYKRYANEVRKVFTRVLKRVGLPSHFSPHCLRHTYASLLLSEDGGLLLYVKEQLGHASIQMTVDTYGKWLKPGNKGAVDRLLTTKSFRVAANA